MLANISYHLINFELFWLLGAFFKQKKYQTTKIIHFYLLNIKGQKQKRTKKSWIFYKIALQMARNINSIKIDNQGIKVPFS